RPGLPRVHHLCLQSGSRGASFSCHQSDVKGKRDQSYHSLQDAPEGCASKKERIMQNKACISSIRKSAAE
ncbi:MAG: hypothetical protein KJS87_04890, partial [Alphaproteobacteria bacterium]|nr:hypothetical protein [Alphaproteobacteria bacterium]